MKYLIILLILCVSLSGCLSGGGDDDTPSDSGTTNPGTTTRTVSGYAKGKIPEILTSSSSAPSHALSNPSEWLVTLLGVTDTRTTAPNNLGEFSIPVYDNDYLTSTAKIKITRNGKEISGNASLENAVIYAPSSTEQIPDPTITLGFFSNNSYMIFESAANPSEQFSAWGKIASGDYSGAMAAFTTILGTSSSDTAKAFANAGLGWAKVKTSGGKLSDGKTYFEQAKNACNLGKIGMCYIYISETQNLMDAIGYFEAIGLSDTTFRYNEAEIVGITNHELFASLAYCYLYVGDYDSANRLSNNISSSSEAVCTQVSQILTEFGVR